MFIYPSGFTCFAGVDEVGRGPLCGDVVTAAVILDHNRPILGLMDSKKLSEKKRDRLYDEIKEKALAYSVARAVIAEIDALNIYHATFLAMQRAVQGLNIMPEAVLVDGNRSPIFNMPSFAVVKGDTKVPEISAASILAKVTRDREMHALDALYPQYGLAKHKGYPTKQHLEAIEKYGVNAHYRTSFAPVKRILVRDQNASMK